MIFFNNILINEISSLALFFLFVIFLSFLILFLSLRVGINNPDIEKVSPYECGFEPFEDARNRFDVRFYIVAILFLIFDIEVLEMQTAEQSRIENELKRKKFMEEQAKMSDTVKPAKGN